MGFAVAAVAWVLHVAAMAVAPLSLVQAVIAGGLVLIAFPAQRYFGHRLNRREWLGLGLAAAGLAFLAVTVPHASENEGYSIATLAGFEAVLVGAGCALFASGILRRGSICHGVVLGLASGLLIGVSNVAIKALTEAIDAGGAIAIAEPVDAARRDRRHRRLLRPRPRDAARRGDPGDRHRLGGLQLRRDPRRRDRLRRPDRLRGARGHGPRASPSPP